jgi:hypothetical protein
LVTQTSVLGGAFATHDAAAFVFQGAVRDGATTLDRGGDLAIVNTCCNLVAIRAAVSRDGDRVPDSVDDWRRVRCSALTGGVGFSFSCLD